MEGPSSGRAPETACRVCGDKASGKHYGVPSCDGCRGFFKRSIRRNLDYVCKENNRCIVDVTRRNQCQACRFSKCLRVNMKKDAVQHERAPRTCVLSTNISQSRRPPLLLGARCSGALPSLPFPPFAAPPYLDLTFSAATETMSSYHGVGGVKTDLMLSPMHYQMGGAAYFAPHLLYPTFIGAPGTKTNNIEENARREPQWEERDQPPNQAKEDEVTSSEETSRPSQSIDTRDIPTDTIDIVQKSSFQAPNGNLTKIQQTWETKSNVSLATTTTDSYGEKFKEVINKCNFEQKNNQTLENIYNMIIQSKDIGRNTEGNSKVDPATQAVDLSSNFCESMYEAAAQILFLTVKWVKAIPSFLQLTKSGQDLLLRASWRELFIITAAQWGLPIDEESAGSSDLRHHARCLAALTRRFNQLRLDHTEFACLKAVVLFRPEALDVQLRNQVEWLQDQVLDTLQHHSPVRCSRLIMLLSTVTRLAINGHLEELFFKHTVGDVAIEKLLHDLDHNIQTHR